MEQYIDKSALVAEIEKRRNEWQYGSSIEAKYKKEECDDILSSLNTLEVKEVDLEKESKHYLLHQHKSLLATDAFIKKAKKWFNRKNGIIITDTKAFFEEFIDYMGIE